MSFETYTSVKTCFHCASGPFPTCWAWTTCLLSQSISLHVLQDTCACHPRVCLRLAARTQKGVRPIPAEAVPVLHPVHCLPAARWTRTTPDPGVHSPADGHRASPVGAGWTYLCVDIHFISTEWLTGVKRRLCHFSSQKQQVAVSLLHTLTTWLHQPL